MRIWIVALALVLVAAPVHGDSAELTDAATFAGLCDEVVTVELAPEPSAVTIRTALATRPEHSVLPAPALARIFRPPRPAFA